MAMALAALKPFGITKVLVTTMQAISGAGYPGHSAYDMTANVYPFIKNEEPKIETETQKILGECTGDALVAHSMKVSAACNRVQVLDGHTETVAVEFGEKPGEAALLEALRGFRGLPQERKLPSAPPSPVIYMPQTTVRSRDATSIAKTAWRSSSAVCASVRCCTGSSWQWATTPCAAPPARPCR